MSTDLSPYVLAGRLERSSTKLMVVFVKLILAPTVPDMEKFVWPAMQQPKAVEKFVDRNIQYVKSAQNPVHREQPLTQSIEY